MECFYSLARWIILLVCASVSFTLQAAEEEVKPKSTSERANPTPEADPVPKFFAIKNLTGTFDLTSNYIFRGQTQTENLPGVQGGFTYTFPPGLYVTLWASNNKFLETDINLEVDPGIGFYKEITEDFNFNITFYRYFFPSDNQWNYNEWLGQVNFKFLQSNLGYSNNVFAVGHAGYYLDGGINYTIPPKYLFGLESVNFLALFGRYQLPDGLSEQNRNVPFWAI